MNFDQLPDWAMRMIWTGITIGAGYAAGHLLNALVLPRLSALARRTRGQWDDIVIAELKKRLPFLAFLIGIWLALGHWTIRPDAHALIVKVLVLVAGMSITFGVAAVLTKLVISYHQRTAPEVPVTGLAQSMVRIVVLIVGILMIARALGLDITAALTALGVGGLAVALALQEPLSNLFAGLFLSLTRQIRVGDFIQLETGQEGFIQDLDWRSTRIQMLSNSVIIVPNHKLSQSIVVNHGPGGQEMSVGVQVSIEYGSDLDTVERIALEVAREVMRDVPGAASPFQPAVRFHTFGESGLSFTIGLRAKHFTDQYLLKHELIRRLNARFTKEGIRLASPIRSLSARGPIKVEVSSGTGEKTTSGVV